MLTRLLHRSAFNRWLSLRAPTYTRPEQIDWLRLKFQGSHRFSEKLQYLHRLEHQGRLPQFYETKPIGQLDDQQIFFLMNSSSPFNLVKTAQRELMAKIESTFFKCLLLKEFRWIGPVEQYTIVFRFNEEVFEMEPYEIGFCLQIITEFVSVYQEIDANNLEKTLLRYADIPEQAYHMLLISGYVSNMNLDLKKFLTKERLEKWISQNNCWDFRAIYFTYRLSERLDLPLPAQLKETLDKHMRSAILKLQLSYFESNYLVFLLAYYPEYVHLLNILTFTPRAYNGYLRFYQNHTAVKIHKHKIPLSVLQLADNESIREIFQLRIVLELDTPLSLAKSLEDYFVYSLTPVNNLLRFLVELKLHEDLEIEFIIEKAITHKLKLEEFNPDILEDYSANQIIKLISKLVKAQMGTFNFWKRTARWIDRLIEYNKDKHIIEQELHIIISLITIISRKNFKEETKALVYQMAREMLENGQSDYSLYALYGLTRSLSHAKIGEDELWILIQHRLAPFLDKQKRNNQVGIRNKDVLVKMAMNFGSMSKGSYQLWTQFNSILDNESKTLIHSKLRSSLNPAQLYLKLSTQES